MGEPIPGPYRVKEGSMLHTHDVVVDNDTGGYHVIATVYGCGFSDRKAATARLFGVSPELLKVAQWLVDYAFDGNTDGMLEAASFARRVLEDLDGEDV